MSDVKVLSDRAELALRLDGKLMRPVFVMRSARARIAKHDYYQHKGKSPWSDRQVESWYVLVEKAAREIQSIVADYMINVRLLEVEEYPLVEAPADGEDMRTYE